MGSGFKDWSPGDVLTAADVDGYLMRQTVMTFADASARDTALSGVLDEGMVAYLEDTNAITVYNGSSWVSVIDSDVLTVDTSNNRVGINDSTPSYALDVTGDINATGDLRIGGTAIGEWTSYTPGLTGWTLGNGSISARYCRINNFVMVTCDITTGTTTSVTGTGMKISLPVTAASARSNATLGPVWFFDGSTNQYFGQVGGVSTTQVMFNVMSAGGTYVGISYTTSTTPFTWNAVRSVFMTFIYEGS